VCVQVSCSRILKIRIHSHIQLALSVFWGGGWWAGVGMSVCLSLASNTVIYTRHSRCPDALTSCIWHWRPFHPLVSLSPSHPQAAGCYQFCRRRRRRRLQAVDCSSSSMSSAFCCCVYIFECILPPSYLPLYLYPCVCRTLFFFSSYKRTFCLFSTCISPLLLFYLFVERQF